MSLSIANTCSIFNFINELLQEQVLNLFHIRFLIFSGLIHSETGQKFSSQISNKLHKIANLFEITDKCGFYKQSAAALSSTKLENISNMCLI